MFLCKVVLFSGVVLLGAAAGSAKTHNHSVHSKGHGPLASCADLHMSFDDRDAVVRSEEKSLSKAEVKVLEVRSQENGGVQISGWDKDSYGVTICKAAGGSSQEAEKLLSQISVSTENGKIATRGPSGDDWTVYLLIHVPKSATIDLETKNGPLSLFDVDGKLTARAQNGPISLKNFSGDADVQAENGPIDVDGGSGSFRVHTQNGPISVALQGNTWSGSGLKADAQNGPLNLSVPGGYQSSFMVESKGYSPVSCHGSVCDNAQKTWDDDHKRIEYGSKPAVIYMSAVNGPISVSQSK